MRFLRGARADRQVAFVVEQLGGLGAAPGAYQPDHPVPGRAPRQAGAVTASQVPAGPAGFSARLASPDRWARRHVLPARAGQDAARRDPAGCPRRPAACQAVLMARPDVRDEPDPVMPQVAGCRARPLRGVPAVIADGVVVLGPGMRSGALGPGRQGDDSRADARKPPP